MSLFSRRGFLAGVGSAAAATIAIAAPSIARAQPAENPDLLALGPKLEAAEQAFNLADEAKRQAVAAFNAICPTVPPELTTGRGSGTDPYFRGEREEDAEGNVVRSSDGHSSRWMISATSLRIDVQDYSARTKFGRLARQKLKIAEAYEQARASAREVSGVDMAIEARYFAACDLERVGGEIHDSRALTMAGALLKARALSACAATGTDLRYRASLLWAQELAATVLLVGSPGAAT